MSLPLAPGEDDPERILERLRSLHPVLIDLSLGRLERLLAALDRPHLRMPPAIHVAGTNGKGSTTAFLRAIAEAAGLRVHATISPHLVSVTERFVLAGRTIEPARLAAALRDIERVNANLPITVFEVLIACAFDLFARTEAELVVLETGLGGRFDATNVAVPICSAITSVSLDHQDFLGDTIEAIAFEKAGIIKRGVVAITGRQPDGVLRVLDDAARRMETEVLARDRDWTIEPAPDGLVFQDAHGVLPLPEPSLAGRHQHDNAGIAIASIRACTRRSAPFAIPDHAFRAIAETRWAARMERLHGALARTLPEPFELWLDGGHNPGAGSALADHLRRWEDRPIHLVIGMKQSKDVAGFLSPILPFADRVYAVAEPGQEAAVPVEAIVAASGGRASVGPDLRSALAALAGGPPGRILICGSLYLAGIVLRLDRGCA